MAKILKLSFNIKYWLPKSKDFIYLISGIDEIGRLKLDQFNYKIDVKRSLFSQILTRFCLTSLLNLKWNEIVLGRDENGRPFLKNESSQFIDFNTSHAGDYVIITAVSFPSLDAKFKVGCDVMKVDSKISSFEDSLTRYSRVINKKFTDKEIDFINSRESLIEKVISFYRLWCLKESFIKSIGTGFKFDIKRIDCIISDDVIIENMIVNNTKIIIDQKLVENVSFTEEVLIDRPLNSDDINNDFILHFMTTCLNTNECLNILNENQKFTQLKLDDIRASLVPLISPTTNKLQKQWRSFENKADYPNFAILK
jgi:phosphopantetheine--protein transferase-like protein